MKQLAGHVSDLVAQAEKDSLDMVAAQETAITLVPSVILQARPSRELLPQTMLRRLCSRPSLER